MNAEIAAEVARIVTELRHQLRGRRQYPSAKHQDDKLAELGLIEAMPRGYRYQDAAEVIRQATTGARREGAMNASGEGEEWTTDATPLFKLLNPAPIVEVVEVAEFDAIDAIEAAQLVADRALYKPEDASVSDAEWVLGDYNAFSQYSDLNALAAYGKSLIERGAVLRDEIALDNDTALALLPGDALGYRIGRNFQLGKMKAFPVRIRMAVIEVKENHTLVALNELAALNIEAMKLFSTDAARRFGEQFAELLEKKDVSKELHRPAGWIVTRYWHLNNDIAYAAHLRGDGDVNNITVAEQHMLKSMTGAAHDAVVSDNWSRDSYVMDVARRWVSAAGNSSRYHQLVMDAESQS